MNHNFLLKLSILILSLQSFANQTACAQQQPTTPKSDDEVLLVLPKSFLENRGKLSELRDLLNANPDNSKLAAGVASQYLILGNRSGDPRFYGYARAAINPWWDTDASPAILEIRAKLKEKDHLYDDALKDLKSALKKASKDTQISDDFKAEVLLRIGNIYRVQGRYDDAMDIGDQIQSIAGDIPAALCRAPIMAQTGQAEEAYDLLSKILPQARGRIPVDGPIHSHYPRGNRRRLGPRRRSCKALRRGNRERPGRFLYVARVWRLFA